MKFSKTIVLSALATLLFASIANAQVTLPQVPTLNPTADRVQVVPNGQPSAQSVYASPAEINTTSYAVKRTPTGTSSGDGYTSTFGNYQSELLLLGSLTMTYAYVTMAPNPSDGARECVFSRAAVTALWLTANTSQTVTNPATSLSANSRTCLTFSAANLTWDRSQ